jgi:glucose-1-phosphate adenylyltransferase
MIADGCVIAAGARVEKSVLSPGVSVGPGTVIRSSVILTDVSIEAGVRVERTVIDKIVRIGRNARIGQAPRHPKSASEGFGITTVGKNAQIPAGITIPRGSVVAADATQEYFLRATPLPPVLAKKK